jgi:tRNA/rRNA methyltransferase
MLSNIRIVLVGPLYGGNVGSVCRAMANTGLSDLALVAPPALDLEEARMMACHAHGILDKRRTFASLEDAVADCTLVAVTSARQGLYRQHARPPRDWAPDILAAAAAGPTALVFGREDKGLTNEELALGTHIIQIPTAADYTSINLSQAVMICCYELFVAADVFEQRGEKAPDAPAALRERLFGMWRRMLLEIGFMKDDKADHMMMGVRRVFGRGIKTIDDVKIMMGVARQALWASGHHPDGDDAAGNPE